MAGQAGADRDRDRQVGLSGAGRPEQHHVLAGVQEVQLCQVEHLGFADPAGEGEVELLEALSGRKAGGPDAKLAAGIWIFTLFGFLGDHPPKEPEGLDDFARSLPFQDLYDAVRFAEPIAGPAGFRFPASVRRRYERMRRLPEGLAVMGDAMCSFNPIYGQGMTVAGLQALALRDALQAGPARGRRVMSALARAIDAPWELTVGADLAVPGVEGPRTVRRRIAGAYVTRLQRAAARDPALAEAFMRVTGLVDPPDALMRPPVALRVLRAGREATGRAGRRSGAVERRRGVGTRPR